MFLSFGLIFPPLGLLYIGATAERAGYDITVQDFAVSKLTPTTFDFSGYDVVGITSDTRRFPGAVEIAKNAKLAGAKIIMGGAHPGFIAEEILMAGHADYIIKGEGDETFPELLDAIRDGKDISKVKGIIYLQDGEVIKTESRPLITDLDSLPLPARHLVDIEAYKKAAVKYGGVRPITIVSTSRGCPYECTFCLTPQLSGRMWRARSAESVMLEVEELYYKYGYRAIGFCDDNFTIDSQRVIDLSRMITERGMDLWWWCLSSPNILLKNEDMVREMSKAGAKTVYIGVESASPDTLKEFNKSIQEDTAYQAIQLLRRNNMQVFGSYILGGLSDDLRTILQTIKLAKKLDTEVAQFSILTPYPGTELYNKLVPSLRHKKWDKFDGMHLVFKHSKVSYFTMQMLLLWAYTSYYTRGGKAIKSFLKVFINNAPILKGRQKRKVESVAKET